MSHLDYEVSEFVWGWAGGYLNKGGFPELISQNKYGQSGATCADYVAKLTPKKGPLGQCLGNRSITIHTQTSYIKDNCIENFKRKDDKIRTEIAYCDKSGKGR